MNCFTKLLYMVRGSRNLTIQIKNEEGKEFKLVDLELCNDKVLSYKFNSKLDIREKNSLLNEEHPLLNKKVK